MNLNPHGRMSGKSVQAERPYEYQMTYGKLRQFLEAAERAGVQMTGYITFSQDNFREQYSEESRTYSISSNNNAFRPDTHSPTMYGSALDGTDSDVDLSNYLDGEHNWAIQRCYMMSDDVEQARELILNEYEQMRWSQSM